MVYALFDTFHVQIEKERFKTPLNAYFKLFVELTQTYLTPFASYHLDSRAEIDRAREMQRLRFLEFIPQFSHIFAPVVK